MKHWLHLMIYLYIINRNNLTINQNYCNNTLTLKKHSDPKKIIADTKKTKLSLCFETCFIIAFQRH